MTVRIGFIGAGGIAHHHMENLAKIPSAKMVAFTDVRKEAADESAKTYSAKAFTDYRKMLKEVPMDAVYVCVPPNAHGDMEIDAARKGLHLFVEKPVNIDVKKALAAADAIDKAGVIAVVGYSLRYLPMFEQLRAVLRQSPMRQAVVTRWGSLPKNSWWRVMASSGGQLVEMVTHQIDLLRGVAGEIESVAAVYSYDDLGAPDGDVPSHYNVVMEMAGGAAAVFSTSCMSPNGKNDMVMVTPKAVVEVNYGKGVTVRPEGAIPVPELAQVPSIDECFVKAVEMKDRAGLKSEYRDAVRSLAVSIACNVSAEERRVVEVDELME